MTLPIERTNAILNTESFLKDLVSPSKTPKIPKYIREEARRLLRHYPSLYDFKIIEYGWDKNSIAQCPFETEFKSE